MLAPFTGLLCRPVVLPSTTLRRKLELVEPFDDGRVEISRNKAHKWGKQPTCRSISLRRRMGRSTRRRVGWQDLRDGAVLNLPLNVTSHDQNGCDADQSHRKGQNQRSDPKPQRAILDGGAGGVIGLCQGGQSIGELAERRVTVIQRIERLGDRFTPRAALMRPGAEAEPAPARQRRDRDTAAG